MLLSETNSTTAVKYLVSSLRDSSNAVLWQAKLAVCPSCSFMPSSRLGSFQREKPRHVGQCDASTGAELTDERGLVERPDCYTPGNATSSSCGRSSYIFVWQLSSFHATNLPTTWGGVSCPAACNTDARNTMVRPRKSRVDAMISSGTRRRKRDRKAAQGTVNIIGIVASEVLPLQNQCAIDEKEHRGNLGIMRPLSRTRKSPTSIPSAELSPTRSSRRHDNH